ncbi:MULTISPECIES: beta-lactamase hydrolase domain-containing protein [Rhodopirellula]|uniref:Beta-lactamase hydrolase-like protein n=1 Tax=Rhodopirellula europaea SH398 TaxID=1263868 RepID=M5SA98_9BACT|nr:MULTISPECIES: protein tyrosine phosphatase family protein [Rhodopirellula]EMI28563.1 Beta-lactamase hydrolase-like protein [Rhodopirellula europaea SH398]MCR9207821.1 protein tyrosine phosphatase family protein [bacterium]
MSNRMKFNDQLTVGPQPSQEELKSLPDDGFRSVINFRTAGEDEQPLSPEEEGEVVQGTGLKYLHVPVSMDGMDEKKVDQFREQYQSLPKPVFAHCKSGKRAGAMMMMHTAVEQGISGEQALEKAKEMGFECDKPELEQFVKQYVNNRTQAAAN